MDCTKDMNDPGQGAGGSRGGSCIVDPLSNFLARPDFEVEVVLLARIDLDDTNHYARADVFQLFVHERAQRSLRRVGDHSPRSGDIQLAHRPPPPLTRQYSQPSVHSLQ